MRLDEIVVTVACIRGMVVDVHDRWLSRRLLDVLVNTSILEIRAVEYNDDVVRPIGEYRWILRVPIGTREKPVW